MKKSACSDRTNEADRSVNGSAYSQATPDVQRLVTSYDEYLRRVQGLADETRRRYLPFAARFLTWQFAGTPDWSRLDGESVAGFLRREAARLKTPGHRAPLTAIRSLLRFMVFTGFIAAGLEGAVPRWRRYRHATLPVHLSDNQVRLTLDTCRCDNATGLRDRAILLLLSRWLCQLDLAHFDGLIWPPWFLSCWSGAGASPGGRRGGRDQRHFA